MGSICFSLNGLFLFVIQSYRPVDLSNKGVLEAARFSHLLSQVFPLANDFTVLDIFFSSSLEFCVTQLIYFLPCQRIPFPNKERCLYGGTCVLAVLFMCYQIGAILFFPFRDYKAELIVYVSLLWCAFCAFTLVTPYTAVAVLQFLAKTQKAYLPLYLCCGSVQCYFLWLILWICLELCYGAHQKGDWTCCRQDQILSYNFLFHSFIYCICSMLGIFEYNAVKSFWLNCSISSLTSRTFVHLFFS